MNWQKIIKEKGKWQADENKRKQWESDAVRKLTGDSTNLYDMGHNEIGSVNNYLTNLIKNDGKYERDEHYEEYSEIMELSQKLEVTMDNLEDYLLDARELLQNIGL